MDKLIDFMTRSVTQIGTFDLKVWYLIVAAVVIILVIIVAITASEISRKKKKKAKEAAMEIGRAHV